MFQTAKAAGTTANNVFRRLYPWKSKEDFAKTLLSHHLIFQQDGIIAINKPFGVGKQNVADRLEHKAQKLKLQGIELPSPTEQDIDHHLYHTRGVGSSDYSMEDVLPILRRELGLPQLEIVKCAEKFTSGVSLLSMNETSHEIIRKSLLRAKTDETPPYSFYVIVLNIPKVLDTCSGLPEKLGIGLAKSSVTDEIVPIIRKDYSVNQVKRREIHPITVQAKILDRNTNLNVSCLAIKVTGTRNNFLRVYCAEIAAPILGDQLYHGRVRSVGGVMVPLNPLNVPIGSENQPLRKDVLAALGFKNPKDSIKVPLQAHLQSVTLSRFYSKNKSLTIRAPPLRENFMWACEKLGLRVPHPESD